MCDSGAPSVLEVSQKATEVNRVKSQWANEGPDRSGDLPKVTRGCGGRRDWHSDASPRAFLYLQVVPGPLVPTPTASHKCPPQPTRPVASHPTSHLPLQASSRLSCSQLPNQLLLSCFSLSLCFNCLLTWTTPPLAQLKCRLLQSDFQSHFSRLPA